MHKKKILIVDDDIFNRSGLKQYLEIEEFDVLEAGDEETAWNIVQQRQLDATIIDIAIPLSPKDKIASDSIVGLTLAKKIKQVDPRLGVVLFSAHGEYRTFFLEMLQAGITGLAYKLKGCNAEEILLAIYESMKGKILIDSNVSAPKSLAAQIYNQLSDEEKKWVDIVLQNLPELTPRERETAMCIAASQNLEGLALTLSITPKSAENYANRVYNKLGLSKMEENEHLRPLVILVKANLIDSLS